jgi:hypothetical protein
MSKKFESKLLVVLGLCNSALIKVFDAYWACRKGVTPQILFLIEKVFSGVKNSICRVKIV